MASEKKSEDADSLASETDLLPPAWKDVESFDELIALAEQLKPAVPNSDAPK